MPLTPADQQLVDQYLSVGYVVFRGVLPPALINELRRECDKARELARKAFGPNTQRLQPVSEYELDLAPFKAVAELPELRRGVDLVCGSDFSFAGVQTMGIFIEPLADPWCLDWHRDIPENLTEDEVVDAVANPSRYHQFNCALYEDTCTWYVEGSHLHPRLSDGVRAAFPQARAQKIDAPELEGLSAAERERSCTEFCERMPGAKPLRLNAGDFLLYRNSGWHLGNYLPYKKRATLVDYVMNEEFRAWVRDVHGATHVPETAEEAEQTT